MRIKPRAKPHGGETRMFSQLIIKHPHYDDYNTLLRLPALNEEDTIDYDTALTICGIVCDNSYGTGWFAKSRDGSNVCPSGAPLKAGEVYYFAFEDRSCRCLFANSLSGMLTLYAQINTLFVPAGTNGVFLRTKATFPPALPRFKSLLHLHT